MQGRDSATRRNARGGTGSDDAQHGFSFLRRNFVDGVAECHVTPRRSFAVLRTFIDEQRAASLATPLSPRLAT
jgi:hypothetical protein